MGNLPVLILHLIVCAVVGEAATTTILPGVRHLMGEADFRSVTLRWECDRLYPAPHFGFRVNYCEMQAWGHDRCRMQDINATSNNEVMMATNSPVRMFIAQINGLRMATNYSFDVWPVADGEDQDLISNDVRGNLSKRIILETKGFSAKATLCLPQFSEVEVETGPYFGGRIAVEGADETIPDDSTAQNSSADLSNLEGRENGDTQRTGKGRGERKGRCWVDGDPESPRTSYVLRIDHGIGLGDACGEGSSVSTINDTAVSAFVMVQESRSILTHSARRFLVLCSYQPGTLTVRAGIQLPSSGNKDQNVEESYGYGDEKGEAESINDVRMPRILRQSRDKKYDGLIMARARTAEKLSTRERKKSATSAQLVLMLLLVVAGIVGFAILAVWRFVIVGTKWRHALLGEHDGNESICENENTSEVCSNAATVDVENGAIENANVQNDKTMTEAQVVPSSSEIENVEKQDGAKTDNDELKPKENDKHILKIHVHPSQSDV